MKQPVTMVAVLCLVVGLAMASTQPCPEAVKAAIEKAYPGATVDSCKQEKEKGITLFEVKVTTKDAKKLEIDVAPDGKLLQTEEKVAVESVPQTVMDGFHAKYKDAKPSAAEKQVKADGTVQYELTIGAGKQKKEITLSLAGKVLEVE